MKQLDWKFTEEKAKRMLDAELIFAIDDCRKAGLAALDLERAGCMTMYSKSQGYYADEASVYAAELALRRPGVSMTERVIRHRRWRLRHVPK